MKNRLKEVFENLLTKFSDDKSLIDNFWDEIEVAYSKQKRHYHSLVHLHHLLAELDEVKDSLEDYDIVLFTLFYHDIIYDALRKDNEEKSAAIAVSRMKSLGISNEKIGKCYNQIIATKEHKLADDPDTNYFTDADLSILGKDWKTYQSYYKNVRKEYAMYPNLLYNPGRRKVLKHFIEMDSIFKTYHFLEKYEAQARINLARELKILS